MKNQIICGRPLSPRELGKLAWFLIAMVNLFVAIYAILLYPVTAGGILAIASLGVSLVALDRAGFLQDLKRVIRDWKGDYRLYYKRKS